MAQSLSVFDDGGSVQRERKGQQRGEIPGDGEALPRGIGHSCIDRWNSRPLISTALPLSSCRREKASAREIDSPAARSERPKGGRKGQGFHPTLTLVSPCREASRIGGLIEILPPEADLPLSSLLSLDRAPGDGQLRCRSAPPSPSALSRPQGPLDHCRTGQGPYLLHMYRVMYAVSPRRTD